MDAAQAPRRLMVVAVILVSLCGVLGCQREPHPRAELVGLWESKDNYLFVVHGSRYSHYTSIAMLRSPDWRRAFETAPLLVYNQLGNAIATLSLILDPETGVDSLKVVTSSAEVLMLHRRRLRHLAFLKSLGTYTRANFGLGIIYPDGIMRLLILYVITMLIVSNFVSFKTITNDTVTTFVVACFLPLMAGYLFGIFKWITVGWWDPLNAGRTIIYSSTVMLLIPLLSMLDRIQNTLRMYIVSQPSRMVLFFFFLLCEAVGLLVNIGSIINWLK